MSEKLELSDIVLDIPDNQSKGYLRRQKKSIQHQMAIVDLQNRMETARADVKAIERKNGDKPKQEATEKAYRNLYETMDAYSKTLDLTVEYIMGYVIEPKDKEAAREVIENLSEDEYKAVLQRIQEGATEDKDTEENPTIDDPET